MQDFKINDTFLSYSTEHQLDNHKQTNVKINKSNVKLKHCAKLTNTMRFSYIIMITKKFNFNAK